MSRNIAKVATVLVLVAFTEGADRDAKELYRLAKDADADQAEHLTARAMALLAVQQSHVIRLLSRRVRLDGIERAMSFAETVESAKHNEELEESRTPDLPPGRDVRLSARRGRFGVSRSREGEADLRLRQHRETET